VNTLIRVISIAENERRRSFHRPPEGVNWAFLDASTDLIEGLEYDEDLAWAHMRRLLARPEIGVYGSHVRAWRELLAHPSATQILVVEDDVYVDWNVTLHLAALDWSSMGVDFLKFFGRYPAKSKILRWHYPIRDRHLVQYTTPMYGAQIYLLTRRAAEHFERNFRRISRPIDVEMERPWATGIAVAGIVPSTALELSIPSLITNRVGNRKGTRAEVARYLAGRVVEHARARLYRYAGARLKLTQKGELR